jgi:hypothetical protein
MKPYPVSNAPLQPLPIPTECWKSVSLDFIFGLPEDAQGNTGILVFVDRFSKMVHLTAVPSSITAERSAEVFVDTVFRLHGMPSELISDRDIRFTATFWQHVFSILGTRLRMSTADHPQTDGQTERANRILEEILRCYVHSNPSSWSKHLSMAEFAMNNSVHASTTHTPFYVNGLRHPRLPPLLGGEPPLSGGGIIADDQRSSKSSTETDTLSQHHSSELRMVKQCNLLDKSNKLKKQSSDLLENKSVKKSLAAGNDFISERKAVIRFVKDAIAEAIAKQKANADKISRANLNVFKLNDLVLLSTRSLPANVITQSGSSKLLPKYIGPFKVIRKCGNSYTLDLPRRMKTHPTFYVGRLRPYHQYPSKGIGVSNEEAEPQLPLTPPQDVYNHSCGAPNRAPDDARARGEIPIPDEVKPLRQLPRLEEQLFPPPPPPLIDSMGDQKWVVESVEDQRMGKNRTKEYFVRWLGYPSSMNTWEPEHVLKQDVPDLVTAYSQSRSA